ncbi:MULTISPECIES: hypothetical protein [Mycobacterium]|uniref:ESX-1 secretion-associated protein EspA/EspE-like domain-containing protein n=3 Tax=Mycobacterium TaxID=1763 RepID=A0A1X1YJ05_9MYCO|nr:MULTISPECIES: hypothetical protein [Mycobacterium]EUA65508.1 hypothetical protein I553_10805 [Mycobacterium xenopi 4042]ORW11082.1 hypothetical protein AWC14_19390 [Mycobacterium kyorinense]MDA3642015.1 hypothetical protein [Mycobacterium xenopi]MDA3660219.1 hypothetical protein [Mycobacterium xenopi]MDA3664372.1 hypothetical protein [Mycobacterium xenopi]
MSDAEHLVDEHLAAARRVLGTGAGPTDWATRNQTGSPADPNWEGETADRARTATQHLETLRGQLQQARSTAATVIAEAGTISRDAHNALEAIETAWANDKATLRPMANTAFGQSALLQAGIARVNEAHEVVATAAARFSEAAQRLPDVPRTALAVAADPVALQPPGGYIIWCTPATAVPGFICEFLQSDGSIIWRHSPIDITGGMP